MLLGLLPDRYDRLLWCLVAVAAAIVLSRLLKSIVRHLEERSPGEERELVRLRFRETLVVLIATAIPYATLIVVGIVIASTFLPQTAAALGGSAIVAVLVGFGAQRFLMDIIAGTLIAFERWYGVGDFVVVEPAKAGGVVEQFALRTTVIALFNGDRAYIPNSQIIAAVRTPRGFRRYSIEILTTDAGEARHAIEVAGRRAPAGEARYLRAPHVVEEREVGEGIWLVRAQADVPPTMEWLVEGHLFGALRSQLPPDSLLAEPIVYTLDERTLRRYERRVLVR